MAKRMASVLKSVAMPAIGAALGAAVGVALAGASQLDDAMHQLQADTGMTAEEAKLAEHAIAGMYANNLQGIADIGATMAKVHNDLGLTGEAADVATKLFLRFATATGQDAATAVSSFSKLLDAWSLTAADAGTVMDQLIASTQKYGGTVTERQSALAAMAPSLTAANMKLTDGIALLNLFEKSGISAASAPLMLSRALASLKPGQTLDDIIAKISAIEDPTLRAQEAMKVFGRLGGAGMALALKPGMGALSDWSVTASDAAGATDKAALAVESSFGNQVKLKIQAVSAALADMGTNLGEVIGIAAIFGPSITTALTSGLGTVGGFAGKQLAGALTADVMPWMTAGTKIATVLGAALGPALALLAVAAVALVWKTINDGLNVQAAAIQTRLDQVISTQTHAQLLQDKEAIGKGLADIMSIPFSAQLYGDQIKTLEAQLAQVEAKIAAEGVIVGSEFGRGVATGTEAAKPIVATAGGKLAMAFVTSARERKRLSVDAGVEAGIAFGAGAASAADSVVTSGNALMNAFHKPLNVARVRTQLAGALHAKALVDGLKAGDPATREAAANTAIGILTYLDALKGPAYVAGRNAALSVAEGMRAALVATSRTSGLMGSILDSMTAGFPKVVAQIESIYPSYQSQVAKIAQGGGTTAGNAALEAAIKLLGGQGVNAADRFAKAVGGAGAKSTEAKDKLKLLADDAKTNMGQAFDKLNTAARTFFDALHEKNLRAIGDTRDLANAQLDTQIGAINAEVDAARKALSDVQDARRLAELQAAVPAAMAAEYDPSDPAAAASHDAAVISAQNALSDFLAQKNIDRMVDDAKVKVDALTLQKKANDDLAAAAVIAEDARAKAQKTAYDLEMKNLEAYLLKHPAAWKKTNEAVIALLNGQAPAFEAAGAGLGKQFTDGLASYTSALFNAETTFSTATIKVAAKKAVGGPVAAGMPYLVGERGPELLVPDRAGTIIPAGGFGGGGGLTINGGITIQAGSLAGSEAEARSFARSIYDHLGDEARRRGLTLGLAG